VALINTLSSFSEAIVYARSLAAQHRADYRLRQQQQQQQQQQQEKQQQQKDEFVETARLSSNIDDDRPRSAIVGGDAIERAVALVHGAARRGWLSRNNEASML
jgi:hypothetical protein